MLYSRHAQRAFGIRRGWGAWEEAGIAVRRSWYVGLWGSVSLAEKDLGRALIRGRRKAYVKNFMVLHTSRKK